MAGMQTFPRSSAAIALRNANTLAAISRPVRDDRLAKVTFLVQRDSPPDIRGNVEVFAVMNRCFGFVESTLADDFERELLLAHARSRFATASAFARLLCKNLLT